MEDLYSALLWLDIQESTIADVVDLMLAADTDGDAKLSYTEFSDLLKDHDFEDLELKDHDFEDLEEPCQQHGHLHAGAGIKLWREIALLQPQDRLASRLDSASKALVAWLRPLVKELASIELLADESILEASIT